MRAFATQFVQYLKGYGQIEEIATKVASDYTSAYAQDANREIADALYETLKKEAGSSAEISETVIKMASALEKNFLAVEDLFNLDAAAFTDEMLTQKLSSELPRKDMEKVAELRAYGREFIMEILHKALA